MKSSLCLDFAGRQITRRNFPTKRNFEYALVSDEIITFDWILLVVGQQEEILLLNEIFEYILVSHAIFRKCQMSFIPPRTLS